ncbi:MAG: hypothetical protein J7L96_07305 [Bacteroidales bacterium]|nr:hypothetical protein [Bacteroidales bacterium]
MNEQKPLLRLEILVASPPTKKCKAIMEMFQLLLTEFPDRLRLDIYYAGESRVVNPTEGFKKETGKIRKIPSAYVNGKKVASKEVPGLEKVRHAILEALLEDEN